MKYVFSSHDLTIPVVEPPLFHQADTKDLTSSSKFSASCVLTSQTNPKGQEFLVPKWNTKETPKAMPLNSQISSSQFGGFNEELSLIWSLTPRWPKVPEVHGILTGSFWKEMSRIWFLTLGIPEPNSTNAVKECWVRILWRQCSSDVSWMLSDS